ncbi:hypothetical protein [Sphingosinicella sp. LY1275]|uniref:hypothetical protein n=1 Tax=Sphingosinicella sp. LY1275 TaxID=3095379 RepID=UPI002ADEEB0D|nr:hypothetical protein [Sphingosinicella sp. LY1275]MEA1015589.1 hypothetical protein [Sphingosinicella sp. LY1275]
MSAKIGSLNVSLGLDSAHLTRGLNKAQNDLKGFHGKVSAVGAGLKGAFAGLMGGMAVGALTNAIGQGLEYASSLGEISQQLGVTTDTLQTFRHAASQVGISQEDMDKGLAKLTRSLGELQQGAKPMADAFAAIGLSAKQLEGMEAGEAMRLIADGLAKIPDAAKRAAIEVDIFGRTGQKLDTLLAGGSKAINDLTNEARELGLVLTDEQIRKADDAADKYAKLKNVINVRIAAAAADNSGAMIKIGEAAGAMGTGLINAAGQIVEAGSKSRVAFDGMMESVIKADQQIGTALEGMSTKAQAAIGRMVTGIQTWMRDRLNAVWAGVKTKINEVAGWFKWMDDVVVRHSYVPDMVDSIGEHMNRLQQTMIEPARRATDETRKLFQQLMADTQAMQASGWLTNPDPVRLRPGEEPNYQGGPVGDFGEVDTEGLQAIADRATESLSPMSELNNWTQTVGGSLAQLGDIAGGSFGRIVNDITTMVLPAIGMMQQATMQAQSAFAGIGSAIGGFLDLFMGKKTAYAIGGAIGAGLQIAQSFGGFRAKGGPVSAGKGYVVGENGPEFFMPGLSGAILPNRPASHDWANAHVPAATSGTGGITININAKDAVLTHQVKQWVAEGVEIAATRGALGGSAMAQEQMGRKRRRMLA